MSIKTFLFLMSSFTAEVSVPIFSSNFLINLADRVDPGSENSSYKQVTIQLFDKDWEGKDPEKLGGVLKSSEEAEEEETEDCDDEICDSNDTFYLRVIWKRPNSFDWYGTGTIERWYSIQPIHEISAVPLSSYWDFFKRESCAKEITISDLPKETKEKIYKNELFRSDSIEQNDLTSVFSC